MNPEELRAIELEIAELRRRSDELSARLTRLGGDDAPADPLSSEARFSRAPDEPADAPADGSSE